MASIDPTSPPMATHTGRSPSSPGSGPGTTGLAGLAGLIDRQRDFFRLGYTRSLDYRLNRLQDLRAALVEFRPRLEAALAADLGKPLFESFGSEIGFCLTELDHTLKHLPRWYQPRRVGLPILLQPSQGQVRPEPKGVVLILGPWNYPVQLCLVPLIGAIAAGNCAIVKPSETAPEASRAIAELLRKTFDPMYVAAIEGGVAVSQALLDQRFDHLFFTGGATIAKVVMALSLIHI